MNPTNHNCQSDINMIEQTDFRPKKALYANILNNNDFREFLQKNGNTIRHKNRQEHAKSMNCSCEKRRPYVKDYIVPFSSNKLDALESDKLNKLQPVYSKDPRTFKKTQF